MNFTHLPCKLSVSHPKLLLIAVGVTALSACVQFVSYYDEPTDKSVTQLQADLSSHYVQLEQLAAGGPNGGPQSPACQYANFEGQYSAFAARAHDLVVRNSIRYKNELTTTQLELLEKSLRNGVPSTHREATGQCLTAGAVQAAREILDQHFRAILKLELAKKTYREGK